MYGVIREFQAPMGVTHAVRGRFGPTPTSLAVIFARKNSLDTYVVRANLEIARLELLQSVPLGANVFSMAMLRRGTTDLLCVAFDRLRIAIMSWNFGNRDWVTEQVLDLGALLGRKLCTPKTLMRSLDPESLGTPLLRGNIGDSGEPLLRTDPTGRCFAVLAKNQSAIYIVPVRPEEDGRNLERVVAKDDVLLIDLPTEYDTSNVKDFVFLHGTFEPNILILLEPKRTWSGRSAIQRNTCHLLNLSLDIRSKKHSKSWAMDQLPYDSEKLEAVPESAGGGALVLSASVIMQVRHGSCTAGLALNCFGDSYSAEMTGKYDAITKSDTLVECDASHCRFLDYEEITSDSNQRGMQCIALLSLKGGELYFLSVAIGPKNAMSMKRAGSTVIASEVVPINDRFFVLASRLSDSLLIEYQKALETGGGRNGKGPGAKSKSGNRKKRKRTIDEEAEYEMMFGVKPPPESSDEDSDGDDGGKQSALELQDKDEGTRGVYDDEDELGWVFNSGTNKGEEQGKGSASDKWALKVKDTLTCFGPGADLAIGVSPDDVTKTKLDMVVAGGYAKNGCLAVVHQSLRPTNRTEFQVPDCQGVWTLIDPAVTKREKLERGLRNDTISSRNAARRARNTKKLASRRVFVDAAVARIQEEAKAAKQKDIATESGPEEDKGNSDETKQLDEPELNPEVKPEENLEKPCDEKPKSAQASDEFSPAEGNPAKTKGKEMGPPAKRPKIEDKMVPGDVAPTADGTDAQPVNITPEVMADLENQAELNLPLEIEEILEEELPEGSVLHSYMLLSSSTDTTPLRTSVEIEELMDNSAEFVTNERTVAAGNVLNTHAIVQVVPSKVRVLMGGKNQCEYTLPDATTTIKFAQVTDPLVLIQTVDDRMVVLEVKADVFYEVDEDGAMEKPNVGVQEFDEYGMALTSTEGGQSSQYNGVSDRNGSATATEYLSKSQEGKSQSYKHFSLTVEYSTLDNTNPDEAISAAFLYKGPIANEVAKDGILSRHDASSVPANEMAEKKQGPSADKSKLIEPAPVQTSAKDDPRDDSQGEENQIDDEDRMLYGDDNLDEEDMMLYGSGAGDEETKKKEPESGNGGVQENGDLALGEGSDVIPDTSASGTERKTGAAIHTEKGVLPITIAADVGRDDGHLLALSMSTGALRLLSPALGWQSVLEHPLFFVGPSVVEDTSFSDEAEEKGLPRASNDLLIDSLAMMEVSGSALVPGLSTPILLAFSKTGTALIYRAFLSPESSSAHSGRSRLALHRISWRDRTAHILARSMSCAQRGSEAQPNTKESESSMSKTPLVPFTNIAGRGGLFVGGACPFVLFAERGYPRIHSLSHPSSEGQAISREEYDGGQEVVGFTEFHNVKCPRGFVSVGKDGMVRIGELSSPSVMNYDAPTPMRKVSLRCTPHKVAYHAGSATYGVLASMPTLTTREERLARILQSLEKHDKRHYQHTAAQAEAETGDEKAKRVPPLFEELHELRVYRPDTWELIKSYKLQKGEVGLALANMKVDVYKPIMAGSGAEIPSSRKGDDGNESAFASSLKMRPKDMLVVGTGYLNGEDASSRGRLLLFEISRQEVYTDEGGVFTAFQLQLIAEKELFSPVTAVASMEGYVIAGVGPQISVYKLVGDEIIHLSFAFGQLYCSSIASLKQYVVAADMCKSVSFMYFRDRNDSVNFLGKDYEHVTSYATEFLIEHENMSIVVSDGKANVQLMNYAHASVPESRGGKRLLINGGTHFGSRINKFVPVRTPDRKQDIEAGRVSVKAGTHSLLFPTLDGGIGAVVAVTEVEFRKLKELRERVVENRKLRRYGGVNPVEQTAFRPEQSSTVLLEQRLLDSRVIFDVFATNLVEQRMIAREGGTGLDGLGRIMLTLDEVLHRF